jgi:plastocyanin
MRFARSPWAPLALGGCLAFIAIGCSSEGGNTLGPGPSTGPRFTSATLNGSGDLFVFTFPADGSFNYHCGVHGTGMSGTVVVSATGQDSPSVAVGQGGNNFVPPTVQLKTGSYVKWVWSSGSHTVTR